MCSSVSISLIVFLPHIIFRALCFLLMRGIPERFTTGDYSLEERDQKKNVSLTRDIL